MSRALHLDMLLEERDVLLQGIVNIFYINKMFATGMHQDATDFPVAVAAVALLGATTPCWVAAGQLHQAPGLGGAVGACHQAITSQQLTSN